MSFETSMFPNNETSTTSETIIIASKDDLFLNTFLCRTIAGLFTWAAILITSYHVSEDKLIRIDLTHFKT